jgi:NAD(P)H-hydrate epimerase
MSKVSRVKVVPRLPRRRADGHKGLYGHVLLVGGSAGMGGAIAMAANAALRGGAGLVTFAAPRTIQPHLVSLCPCALSLPLACDESGQVAPAAVRQMLHDVKYTVLAVGPGMGRGPGQRSLVQAALAQDRPLVIDADGLNNLAAIEGWPALRRCPMILTPHPGEFGRLTGRSTQEVQADRQELAVGAVRQWLEQSPAPAQSRPPATSQSPPPVVLVLKGKGTVVTDGRRLYVNNTGNPGMASGGTGDVLTGLTAALLGQGLEPFDAAVLAVYLHGLAGDLAARKLGEVSLIASDLVDFLPAAFVKHQKC